MVGISLNKSEEKIIGGKILQTTTSSAPRILLIHPYELFHVNADITFLPLPGREGE